jgi:DNA-binding CsgD family transcriptional regulator/transcriptional regulator with XRE-family HTH domain/tetratricopeptide (TPR) repeat protein
MATRDGPRLSDLVRRHRTAAALSQEALAERAGLSVRAISDLERGVHQTPRLETVRLVAVALGLPEADRADLFAAARPAVLQHGPGGTIPVFLPALPVPLVGRDREQALLRGQLTAALSGHGGVTLIGGEAGIGKSTLASALGHEAIAHGASVLVGHAYQTTECPPYGPWAELLAHGAARLEGLPSPLGVLQPDEEGASASQSALFAAVRDYLEAMAARGSVVLILEDVHWADPISLDLLRFLARQVAAVPLLLLVTYRSDELSKHHPLSQLLPMLVREAHATRLSLGPLQGPDVRAFVRTRYRLPETDEDRLVAYLTDHADGNPFFSGELLRTFEEEALLRPRDPRTDEWVVGDLTRARVPSLLRQVIDGRLARLGEEVQRLLAVAAVIGQEAPLALWGRVGDVSQEAVLAAVEAAVEAHLLEETRDGLHVRFVHALIREAVYAGLPPSPRRRWHRLAGEVLAAGPLPDPDAVAHHFRQAGDPRAISWLVRAGERAQRLYAWWTAAERFEAALALMAAAEGDARERGWLLYRTARLRRYSSPEQGIGALEEAERLAGLVGDQTLAAYALTDRGALRCFAGDLGQGLAELEAGIAALEAVSDTEENSSRWPVELWVADALPADGDRSALRDRGTGASASRRGTLAIWLAMVGRLEQARAEGERVLAQAPASGAPTPEDIAIADAYLALGIAYGGLGRPEQANTAFRHARDLFVRIKHHIGVTHAAWHELQWSAAPYQADDPTKLRQLAADAEREWAQASGAAEGPFGVQLPVLLLQGRWVEARSLAQAVHAIRATVRDRPAIELAWLAHQQRDAGMVRTLTREVLPAGPASEPGGSDYLTALELLRAEASLAVDAGDLALGRTWLEAHDRWLAWSGAVLGRAEGYLAWGAYQRAAGDLHLAYHHATQALAHATAPRQPLALLAAHRLLGELDTAGGRHHEAAAHLEQALVLADACAAPYERALTLLSQAGWHEATGDRGIAQALLDEVRAICEPLGAIPVLARADALTERLMAEISPVSSGGYPAGLTEREVEVLRLIAAGKSNREIGADLFLSPRTIERHITNAYRKIDARGKADATAYVLRHHLA